MDRVDSVLRQTIEDRGARVRERVPRVLRWVLPSGVAAITIGRTIWIAVDSDGRSREWLNRLIRHELAHVEQYRELGIARFLFRYCGEYLTHRRRLGHEAAYRAISFEIEARRAETETKQV